MATNQTIRTAEDLARLIAEERFDRPGALDFTDDLMTFADRIKEDPLGVAEWLTTELRTGPRRILRKLIADGP